MHARLALIVLLAGAALAAGADASASAVAAASASPCTPAVTAIDGRRAIAYCGPATVVIALGGRTYRFRNGVCYRSATAGGVQLSVGTLVQGAGANAGRPFVALLIAKSPSESEAFEADSGGRQLFGESVIALGGNLLTKGTFTGVLGGSFSGSWDCHGVLASGP